MADALMSLVIEVVPVQITQCGGEADSANCPRSRFISCSKKRCPPEFIGRADFLFAGAETPRHLWWCPGPRERTSTAQRRIRDIAPICGIDLETCGFDGIHRILELLRVNFFVHGHDVEQTGEVINADRLCALSPALELITDHSGSGFAERYPCTDSVKESSGSVRIDTSAGRWLQ
jgi:hypothetical protein